MSDDSDLPREPLLRSLVGAILRRARLRQGRTLAEVAAAARMSTAYLSEVERGRKEASSEVLAAACQALDLRLVDLVGDAHVTLATVDARRSEARVLRSIGERAAVAGGGAVVAPAPGAGVPPGATTDAVLLAA